MKILIITLIFSYLTYPIAEAERKEVHKATIKATGDITKAYANIKKYCSPKVKEFL